MTMRPSSAADTSFSSVPALAYGVRRPSTTTTSRAMRLSGGRVHALDQRVIPVLQDPPLDLQSRRHGTVLDRQIRRQNGEGADLLVVRLVGVVGVDFVLEE